MAFCINDDHNSHCLIMCSYTGVWRTGMSTVPAAPPIKYVLGYRSRTLTLNPNPITDPNPNPNRKNNHRNEIEHRVISKSEFPRDGGGYIRGL